MRIVITQITPTYPSKVGLQWVLEGKNVVGVFSFDVERSGSPGGPWTKVATALLDTYLWEDPLTDESANILSLGRDIYYRLYVDPPGSGESKYSDIVNLDGQAESAVVGPNPVIGYKKDTDSQYEKPPTTNIAPRPSANGRRRLLRRKILRDEYILMKKLVGMEYYLLKRRHFGTRCTACYDRITRESVKSNCSTCYGTSWVDGYFDPVEMLGRRATSPVRAEMTPQAKMEVNPTQIQFMDFPRIDEEDIIVEKANNRRFLVKNRSFTSLKSIPVHQTVSVSELERNAVEYSISVSL